MPIVNQRFDNKRRISVFLKSCILFAVALPALGQPPASDLSAKLSASAVQTYDALATVNGNEPISGGDY